MKLGSHNSMTYLPPLKWWMAPFKFMAKCQSENISDQYNKYGVRLFDLRIKFYNGKPKFAHGSMLYKGDVYETLRWIDSLKGIYVRIILEENTYNKKTDQAEEFKCFCKKIEANYRNIIFFGGNRKCNWERLYQFTNADPSLDDKYSSTTGTKLDDWWPWPYAAAHNADNIKVGTDKDFLFIDFVNIR